MSDAWAELQALKSKRDSRRKRLEERKKERRDILRGAPAPLTSPHSQSQDGESSYAEECFEEVVLRTLSDVALLLPMDSKQLLITVNKSLASSPAQHNQITNLLQKFAVQLLISIEEKVDDEGTIVEIVSVDHTKLSGMLTVATGEDSLDLPSTGSSIGGTNLTSSRDCGSLTGKKRKSEPRGDESSDEDGVRGNTAMSINSTTSLVGGSSVALLPDEKKVKENDVLSLLSLASTRERENKRIGEEILELLSRPSAKEKTLAERFRSQGGNVVKEFCPHGTKSECRRVSVNSKPCAKLHFRKIIQPHTDETLGDCSFLNTCFHMETCKYVHYEVDSSDSASLTTRDGNPNSPSNGTNAIVSIKKEGLFGALENTNSNSGLDTVVADSKSVLFPAQWVFCDLRYFDMTILGKFSVIMADPPWDIHMELPYGTLSDDEMRHLNIPALQDEGLIFLWVTGRAMELGRECLELWGYERVDELIWVKTNQLQRIIRTGRTGHWLNHGKEHCLVGMKGNPPINRGLDCDVIVAEVRATSHKPDEIYGIIERLSPGTRKIELFGRPHNIQPNWITLGNQLAGSHIEDEEVRARFFARYPDGNCTLVKSN